MEHTLTDWIQRKTKYPVALIADWGIVLLIWVMGYRNLIHHSPSSENGKWLVFSAAALSLATVIRLTWDYKHDVLTSVERYCASVGLGMMVMAVLSSR